MEYKFLFMSLSIFIGIITMISGVFLQESTRNGIFFGVRIPEGYEKENEFKSLKKEFKKNFLFTALLLQLLTLLAIWLYPNPSFMIIGIILLLVALNLNYIKTYKKVKKIKQDKNWSFPIKDVIIVDTSFRNNPSKRALVSKAWFLLPLALIVLITILTFANYDSLPAMLPRHWGFNGKVDGWSKKSFFIAFSLPIVQLLMTSLMYGVYIIIRRSKAQLNPENIDVSREQNRRFRYIWSCFILVLTLIMSAVFTLIQLNVIQMLTSSPMTFIIINILLFSTAIAAVVISIVVGQGGSRIKIVQFNSEKQLVINRDDDKYWIFGDYYYNPDDPSLFVEKRMGVGWDFNYSKLIAKIFMAFIVLLLLFMSIFPLFLKLK